MKLLTPILFLLLYSGLQSEIAAQDSAPSAAAPAGQNSASPPSGVGNAQPPSAGAPSKDDAKALDYIYNEKPKDGTAAAKADMVSELLGDKAKAIDALSGVGSLISPAFEAYLSNEESELALIKAYEDNYDKVVELVRKRQIAPAVELLLELSEYTWDSGSSEQLANRVIAIWDMRRNQKDLAALNERLREKARTAAGNFDMESQKVVKQMQETDRRSRGGSKSGGGNGSDKGNSAFLPAGGGGAVPSATSAVDAVVGKMKLTEEYLRGMESRANVVLNEAQIKEAENKARKDFSGYIKNLHKGQWHHQTKLAADFYRVLFGDGDLPVDVAEMSAKSGHTLQRIRDDVKVFSFKIENANLASATKILGEDFNQSPNHPALRGVKRVDKLKVAEYLANLQKLQNLIEARDFGTLDELLQKIIGEVKDFDPTKPRALVRAVKRESQMRLGMAKLAAQQGQLEKAMGEFKAAAEAWPDNPDLDAASEKFFSTQDVQNKSTVEFDRAAKDANYRRIFENSLEYGVAVKGDAVREEQMKNALEKVKAAETALEKAKVYEQNGDVYGSWETLELAAKSWPEDSKLNQRRAELSIQASVFVSKLSRATKEEHKGNQGVALAYFLNAREDYPPSTMANDAIKRLSNLMLGRMETTTIKEEAGSIK